LPIPQSLIEQIRERARIEEIVRNYVPSLRKTGKNLVGLCPFHKEKTPSFSVSPEKQIFYCFGCHAGGNVFSFISKIERLDFPESVRFVANLVGIRIEEDRKSEQDVKREYLARINRFAMNVYATCLKSEVGRAALEYVQKRGVSDESVSDFNLGFAPDSWHFLSDRLSKKGVSLPLAAELGLVAKSSKEGGREYYDRFRGRLIFPIFDQKNDIIAFGGRIIGVGEPKYLNSPESELFAKGSVLYGFNRAREHISELKRAIVVEGYLDVIGCHQNGIRNVVAPMGTALTGRQVDLLSRYASEIVLLFDADSAGVKASLRSLEVTGARNVSVKIAMLPESDPFEFIVSRGVRPFMAVVDSALNPVDFRIRRAIDDPLPGEPIARLIKLFEIVSEVEFETEKAGYLKKISGLLGIDERSVFEDFQNYMRDRNRPPELRTREAPGKEKTDFMAKGHREMVLLLLHYPELAERAVLDYSEDEIADPVAKSLYSAIMRLYDDGEPISYDRMFSVFPEGPVHEFLEGAIGMNFEHIEHLDAYTEVYIRIKLFQLDRKIRRFAELVAASEGAEAASYMTEIEVLRREKEKLQSYISGK
jgi:DNA primase